MKWNKKTITFLVAICIVLGMSGRAVYRTVYASASLPVLKITLDEGAELFEKEYSDAHLSLSYPGQVNSGAMGIQVRQRGNSTFNYDKKSYKLKLDTEADLLLGGSLTSDNAAKDWILLANYYDKTALRNTYAFLLSSMFSGIEYTCESTFVEVYLNGEYRGVYQLCEEVEIDSARLDIGTIKKGDTGILLECRQSLEQEYGIGLLYGESEFLMYDICSDVISEAQVARAEALLQQAQDAILSGDQEAVAEVIDLPSCIDVYLIQEFTKNIDVGYSSFYLYIKEDEDKIYLGPLWDFDISMGSNQSLSSYEGLYAAAAYSDEQQNPNEWFRDLMQQDWFYALVKARWNEQKEVFLDTMVAVQNIEAENREAFQRNYALWETQEGQTEEAWQADYTAQYTALYSWIEHRYVWLDEYFNGL